MTRPAPIVALTAFCATALIFGQTVNDTAKLQSLRQRAEQGNAQAQFELGFMYESGTGSARRDYAEALGWYRKAAEQGNASARQSIAGMYFEGRGVARDYTEAARWYGCPKPSEEILAGCSAIAYSNLPEGARALLKKMNCRVGPGDNYDYGSAVDLNGDGKPEYQFCCHEAPHRPCSSVLIGKIGSEWKNLGSPSGGLFGYAAACGLFVILESQREAYHDICFPDVCSSFAKNTCNPTIWQFNNGRYREVEFTPAK